MSTPYDRTARCFDCKEIKLGRYRQDLPDVFYCQGCHEKRQEAFSKQLKEVSKLVAGWIDKLKEE